MSNPKIRWGTISTSNIGRVAVNPAIQASKNGELVAIASRDEQRAREFASKHAIPKYYGSYGALLEDEDIDAVYIPLPNSLHYEWTIKAVERGKHVLCEKPLALNASECIEMQSAAQANQVRLMEAFMYRFHPRTEKVIELVQSGALGELRMIHSAFTFRLTRPDNIRWDPALGGGALMDVGCYCVNIGRTVTGSEPTEVSAIARWGNSGVEDQMVGRLLFENGVMAQFDCALTMERREVYEVAGTDGYLGVSNAFLPGTGDTTIMEYRGRGDKKEHIIDGVDEYQLMVEHFTDCVIHNKPFRHSALEAASNMRVIEALYHSARMNGKPVQVSTI
jgi:xylose dehydrogenase (NAD/NADP)